MRNIFAAFEEKLKKEQAELKVAEEITETVFPIIESLDRKEIVNPVMLKAKLAKLPKEYRDAVYGLCRIATEAGPEGSIIVLDPEKVLAIIEEIECEEKKSKKSNKKFIFGFSKKIVKAIKSLVEAKLAVLCHLINDLVIQKIINIPSPDKLKATAVKISSLISHKSNSKQR